MSKTAYELGYHIGMTKQAKKVKVVEPKDYSEEFAERFLTDTGDIVIPKSLWEEFYRPSMGRGGLIGAGLGAGLGLPAGAPGAAVGGLVGGTAGVSIGTIKALQKILAYKKWLKKLKAKKRERAAVRSGEVDRMLAGRQPV